MSNYNNFFGLGGNATTTIAPDFETKNAKFIKLADTAGKEYRLFGYLITKGGKYGQGVAYCATEISGDGSPKLIDLPKRYLEKFKQYTSEQLGMLTSGRFKLTNTRELPARDGMKETYIFDIEEIS